MSLKNSGKITGGRVIYTIVLFDQDGGRLATEPLEAEDHNDAQSAAAIILDVCRDVAYGYEVRFNGAIVAVGLRKRGLFARLPSIELRSTNIVDLLVRLEHSLSAIALSRRLRKTVIRLRRWD